MNRLSRSFARNVLVLRPLTLTSVREKHTPKPKGWKKTDGMSVTAGAPLVYQKTLRYHPGLNVGIGCNMTLFALEHGVVRISSEVAQPNWDHVWIDKFYENIPGQKLYRKYYHVIAEPQSQRFNLVKQI